jgi:hypothetical protein
VDEYFGDGFGIYVSDPLFDRWNYIEPFLIADIKNLICSCNYMPGINQATSHALLML